MSFIPFFSEKEERISEEERPFVDREEFIQAFKNALESIREKEHSVLIYHGVAGIGKTSLRKELQKLIVELNESRTKSRILWTTVNFETEEFRQPQKFLEILRDQFQDEYRIKFHTFDIAHALYWKKVNPRIPLYRENYAEDSIVTHLLDISDELSNIGGILNPTKLLLNIGNLVKKLPGKYNEWALENMDEISRLASMDPSEIEKRLYLYWAYDLHKSLQKTSEDVVIFIDSYEALWGKDRSISNLSSKDQWIGKLIQKLLSSSCLWVLCGQEPPQWGKHSKNEEVLWENSVEMYEIRSLPEGDARYLLKCYGVLEDNIQNAIINGSEGVPYYLDLSIDLYKGIKKNREPTPDDFAKVPAEVFERFIRYLDENKELAIKTLSVPRFWNSDIFNALIKEFTYYPTTGISIIHNFSFINKIEENKWSMHQLMRQSWQEYQEKNEPDERTKIHEFMFNYYLNKLANLDTKRITQEHEIAILEAFYHGKKVYEIQKFSDWFIGESSIFYKASLWSFLLPLFNEALQITENELGNEHPAVSPILNSLGTLLFNMGRLDEAKLKYERALKIRESLLNKNPENIQYKSDVGMILNNYGNLLSYMGRMEESKQKYEESLKIRENLLSNDPENIIYESYVGTTLNNLGNLLSDMRKNEEALLRYERALKIRENLLDKEQENIEYKSSVGATLNNLADLLLKMERLEEAEQRYEESLKIHENLSNVDPENIKYQELMGLAQNNFGNLFLSMGKLEEAKEKYEKALKIRESLLSKDPENTNYQVHIGLNLNDLGNLLYKMGLIEDAKENLERALRIRENLLSKDPENIRHRLFLTTTLNNLGNLLYSIGKLDESKQKYEDLFKIYEKMSNEYPEDIDYQINMGATLNNLGTVLGKMGKLEESKQKYEDAFRIYESSIGRDPDNVEYYTRMGTTLDNIYVLLSYIGSLEEARQIHERYLKISESLLSKDPNNMVYKTYVGISLCNFGELLSNMEKNDESLELFERALELIETGEGPDHPYYGKIMNNIIKLYGKMMMNYY